MSGGKEATSSRGSAKWKWQQNKTKEGVTINQRCGCMSGGMAACNINASVFYFYFAKCLCLMQGFFFFMSRAIFSLPDG